MAKKIFIVGNGFDLSLGLPTSYSDFLVYLVHYFNIQSLIQPVDSPLVKANYIKPNQAMIPNYVQSYLNRLNNRTASPLQKITGANEELKRYNNLTYSSTFLKKIFSETEIESNKNWADLESAYFDFLFQQSKLVSSEGKISQLNYEFLEIRNHLFAYLSKIFNSKNEISQQHKTFLETLCDLRKHNQSGTERDYNFDHSDIHFVNFNYSNSLKEHLNAINPKLSQNVIHIHGNLDDINSIVLGFGNKAHDNYKPLLNKQNNECMKFIKHNHTAFEKAEKEIKELIKSEQFEIYVLGHSLGSTDQSILQTIFNSNNLSTITLLHKDEEHYRGMKLELERRVDRFDDLYISLMANEYLIPQNPNKFQFTQDFLT